MSEEKWICPACGRENTAPFCSVCGASKPAGHSGVSMKVSFGKKTGPETSGEKSPSRVSTGFGKKIHIGDAAVGADSLSESSSAEGFKKKIDLKGSSSGTSDTVSHAGPESSGEKGTSGFKKKIELKGSSTGSAAYASPYRVPDSGAPVRDMPGTSGTSYPTSASAPSYSAASAPSTGRKKGVWLPLTIFGAAAAIAIGIIILSVSGNSGADNDSSEDIPVYTRTPHVYETATPVPVVTELVSPTPSPSPEPTVTPSPTPSPTPTATPEPLTNSISTLELEIKDSRSDSTYEHGMVGVMLQDGDKRYCKNFTVSEVHSTETSEYPIILKNQLISDNSDVDLDFIFEAIDFALKQGGRTVIFEVEESELDAANELWLMGWSAGDLSCEGANFHHEFASGETIVMVVKIAPKYSGSFDTWLSRQREAAAAAAAIVNGSKTKTELDSDYEIAHYMYDRVTLNTTYFTNSSGEEDGYAYYNRYYYNNECLNFTYDALIRGNCVCTGFASSFSYLCQLAGLPAYYVTWYDTDTGTISHAISMVSIDGSCHWFDPTWDRGYPNYYYFGLSDDDYWNSDYGKSMTQERFGRSYYPPCTFTLSRPTYHWNW